MATSGPDPIMSRRTQSRHGISQITGLRDSAERLLATTGQGEGRASSDGGNVEQRPSPPATRPPDLRPLLLLVVLSWALIGLVVWLVFR